MERLHVSLQNTIVKIYANRWVAAYQRRPIVTAVAIGAAICLVLVVLHTMLDFASAMRPLYLIPIWLTTRLGGRRGGLVLVLAVTVIEGWVDTRLGDSTLASWISSTLLRFASLGTIMLLVAEVEDALLRSQRQAHRDSLTGLMNRHAWTSFSAHAFRESVRRRQPLSVAVVDCDDFKLINDRYGHQAGDRVLRLLAEVLVQETRSADLVARIGGDEFVLLLYNLDREGAIPVLARVDYRFQRAAADEGYEAGLSIGLAERAGNEDTLERLLRRADVAMYRTKKEKKDVA